MVIKETDNKKTSRSIASDIGRWAHIAMLCLLMLCWLLTAFYFLVSKPSDYSVAERRKLAAAPTLTYTSLKNGTWLSGMEAYTKDLFPERELFRSLKTASSFYGFLRLQDKGYAILQNHLAKMDMTLNSGSVSYACSQMQYIYDSLLSESNCNIYYCAIPDKNYYLHQADASYPVLDYDALDLMLKEQLSFATPIDIRKDLSLSSFYLTDTHWRQDALIPAASSILSAMTASSVNEDLFTPQTALTSFDGVLSGNMGWNLISDPLIYLTNDTIASAYVTHLEDMNCHSVYDAKYLTYRGPGADPYSFFLSGATAFVTIEKDASATAMETAANTSCRELVIFRDSFGSSIAPLFLSQYDKITLIDTRYINPALISDYITFTDQDVLFLYSTLLLNNSFSLKAPANSR
ncbi:MAG: hypothetical protein ACI4DW_08315 [Lachnospiraceae bacterium]